MKTLVIANQKGGVGKSAVATLLAYYLAEKGQRVLAIDLDHQGNFSKPVRLSARATLAEVSSDMLMTQAVNSLPAQPFVLVGSSPALHTLERQPQMHTPFARNLRQFLHGIDAQFDVCIIDTNPNPDIRVVSALASADFVLSPIQLNLEALDGVGALLNSQRAGVRKIKAVLNPKLELIGLLPTMVESTPFQKENFAQLIRQYLSLLIQVGTRPGEFAYLPRRSAIAEAQSEGKVLWEMKKTAARDAWREIEPSLAHIANVITKPAPDASQARPLAA